MKKLSMFFLGVICVFRLSAQTINRSDYPEVGKPCPDFTLQNVNYYSKKEVRLEDFSGKWLILDFWNKECGACIASFPEVNKLQKEFGEKVQFMMVGIQDDKKQIEPMYAKFRGKENLSMPCAFDSLLAKRWDIYTAPHILVIDDHGMIKGITYHLTNEDIRGFLSGEAPHLKNPFRYDWEKDSRTPFDSQRPFLVNGNGGNDSAFLFRSMISTYNGAQQFDFAPQNILEDSSQGKFQVLGVPLVVLYNYAYFGTIWPDTGYQTMPILEVKDSAFFNYSTANSHNMYCYSLIIPAARVSKSRMQDIIRNDLKNFFGYTATIEIRNFIRWRLIATEKARESLKTKGGSQDFEFIVPKANFIARNFPIDKLTNILGFFNENTIVNCTSISGNIDIKMDCLLTDLNDIKRALRKHELDLIPEYIPKKVLVIRDNP